MLRGETPIGDIYVFCNADVGYESATSHIE